ncbi:TetR/AcrR family transcriptional regulator [Intestinimonas butyriciproducens]|uniref:TetR/AcrR family transcriptional regulator n=1 Tax=Intestinimonas butyriciproducens TaxID=1297617 RepID=UPI0031F6D5F5
MKITREMMLDAVLALTRKQGFESVNARNIATELDCSTRPIFTVYQNMEEMKKDFLEFAYSFYCSYVEQYKKKSGVEDDLLWPLSYLSFAQEEPNLFQLLFVDDMALDLGKAMDFYQEMENGEKADAFAQRQGLERQKGRKVFLDLFLYAHGMAVLTAIGKMHLQQKVQAAMVRTMLEARIQWEKGENMG